MDPRLRNLYTDELKHLRDMGAEFAQHFPKIASRLGMSPTSGVEVADPYVERLLEGVAFLAARVQLKLEAEFPRFTQALLEIVYPHYLAPTPSMLVAQLRPLPDDPNLARGFTIPRGSALHAAQAGDEATAPEFRTAQDVTLWPLTIQSASYFSFAPDLPLAALPFGSRIKGGLRLRLKAANVPMRQLTLDRLRFHVTGHDDVVSSLYELCLGNCLGGLVLPPTTPVPWHEVLPSSAVQPVGFADSEALLPVTLRSFQGYRLLQEYFAFPQRYHFFDVAGLERGVARSTGQELDLVLLFSRSVPELERGLNESNLALFCTPAINLFEKRADRIHVSGGSHEFHVVPDRTRPQDFEVYQVADVVGHGAGAENEQQFRPFYSTVSDDDHKNPHTAFFVTRREPRLRSETQKRQGTRSSYIGTEVFLSLVDSAQAPFSGDLRQLSVRTLCTNRDLPLQLAPGGAQSDLALDIAAPVAGVRIVGKASRPLAPLVDGGVAWRAINHLSLNYLSLADSTPEEGAAALRDLLVLYANSSDATARRQIEGIRSVNVGRVVRRLPSSGPIAFGRGLEISLNVDTLAFEGGSAFLFGSVLNHYLRRYVSLNSFTETVLRSDSRGEINRWVPQWGARPTL
jgi:type VI secretion system protein ImpG